MSEAYRKVRNTCRYLLSNLYDFDPARDAVAEDRLEDIDRYALARHREVVAKVLAGYRAYEFHVIYHQVVQYCAVDLSSFYLRRAEGPPVLRPRRGRAAPLGADGAAPRRAGPLHADGARCIPFTSDEVWALIPGRPTESVHTARFPEPPEARRARTRNGRRSSTRGRW